MSQVSDIGEWVASVPLSRRERDGDGSEAVTLEPIPAMAPFRPRRSLPCRGVVRPRRTRG